jgi:hypothetical protein
MSDNYDPVQALREECDRFSRENTFHPLLVTNFYAQARVVLSMLAKVTAERDAYAKAKAENDERFQLERDEARLARDRLAALVGKAEEWLTADDGAANCNVTNECYTDCCNNAADSREAFRAALTYLKAGRFDLLDGRAALAAGKGRGHLPICSADQLVPAEQCPFCAPRLPAAERGEKGGGG